MKTMKRTGTKCIEMLETTVKYFSVETRDLSPTLFIPEVECMFTKGDQYIYKHVHKIMRKSCVLSLQ